MKKKQQNESKILQTEMKKKIYWIIYIESKNTKSSKQIASSLRDLLYEETIKTGTPYTTGKQGQGISNYIA